MAQSSLTEKSTEQLMSALNAAKKVHLATAIIFAVIILAWVVGGYWRKNITVFIATIAMALAIYAAQVASRGNLVAELKKREALGGE